MSNKYRLQCTVTGLWYAANANRKAKLLLKYGTEKALREKFVSREGKRLQKLGLSVEDIKKQVADGTLKGKVNVPAPRARGRKPGSSKAIKAPAAKPIPSVAEDPEVDPEVKEFLASADSSSKAV